jgi:hypothetical protein
MLQQKQVQNMKCSICEVDLKAPEFRDKHRKVLTVNQAPHRICLLCEDDLLRIGVLDMDALTDTKQDTLISVRQLVNNPLEGDDLTFHGNQVYHALISQVIENGKHSLRPHLRVGDYR